MLSRSFLVNNVKILLGIEDTTLYDARLNLLVGGAVSKLEHEGVPNGDYFEESDSNNNIPDLTLDYLVCCSYQVALDLNLDLDLQTFYVQYVTRVNTLRCSLKTMLI